MPTTTLLLREPLSSSSLTSIVAKSQNLRPPFCEYNLNINSTQLELTLLQKPAPSKPIQTDEGFESDIDSISIVSSDDSFTSSTCLVEDHVLKTRENDSAHGSSSSESDNELCLVQTVKNDLNTEPQNNASFSSKKLATQTRDFSQIRDQINIQIKSQIAANLNLKEPYSLETHQIKLHNLKDQSKYLGALKGSVGQLNQLNSLTNLNTELGTFKPKAQNVNQETKSTLGKPNLQNSPNTSEYYPLQEVLCYTDVNFPKVLIFVTKTEVLVFNFDNLEVLQSFYTNFNTLKAVTNQRTYARVNTKFNLLQRTDNNGVTHIEIAREPGTKIILPDENSSSIISINTPEVKIDRLGIKPDSHDRKSPPTVKAKSNFFDDSKIKLQSELRSSRSEFYPTSINSYTLRPKTLKNGEIASKNEEKNLRKIWNSAEDILDAPKRPERRQRAKRRAPLPPVDQNLTQKEQNILKGQYIRVAVDPKKNIDSKIAHEKPNFQTFSSNIQTFTPNWNNIKAPQSPLILTPQTRSSQNFKLEPKTKSENWTNSVPRLLRKPRSKSETRLSATPMAYRYIDTTTIKPPLTSSSQTISNRLFGLSQKLKEFSNNVVSTNKSYSNFYDGNTDRRNSLGEMTYKAGSTENNLKSVIKKQDDRKNNKEKKVTFSAYATVQVV